MIAVLILILLMIFLSAVNGFDVFNAIGSFFDFLFPSRHTADVKLDSLDLDGSDLKSELIEFVKQSYCKIPKDHLEELMRKSKILITNDGYGGLETTRWDQEVSKYIKNHVIIGGTKREFDSLSARILLYRNSSGERWSHKMFYEQFSVNIGSMILSHADALIKNNATKTTVRQRPTNPIEYELYCGNILNEAGWCVSQTVATGDQGADLIAKKERRVLLVQCKLYSKPVGNKAVQEITSALKYYGGNEGVVVTNSEFTHSAKVLAQANNILLIHDSQLKEL